MPAVALKMKGTTTTKAVAVVSSDAPPDSAYFGPVPTVVMTSVVPDADYPVARSVEAIGPDALIIHIRAAPKGPNTSISAEGALCVRFGALQSPYYGLRIARRPLPQDLKERTRCKVVIELVTTPMRAHNGSLA